MLRENTEVVVMGREAKVLKWRYCKACDKKHRMTAAELKQHVAPSKRS